MVLARDIRGLCVGGRGGGGGKKEKSDLEYTASIIPHYNIIYQCLDSVLTLFYALSTMGKSHWITNSCIKKSL